MSSRYASARFIAGLTGVIGWVLILFGVFAAFATARNTNLIEFALVVGAPALLGVLLLAAAQITGAVLDTAENTAETAATTQRALTALERIAAAAGATATNTETLARRPEAVAASPAPAPQRDAPAAPSPATGTEITVHRGYRIYTDSRGNVSCDGRYFSSLDEARVWVDSVKA